MIQVRFRQHVSQTGSRHADKAGLIRNNGNRRNFATKGIDQLDQKAVACLPQHNSLRRICLVEGNDGYRQVNGQLDVCRQDKFVQMEFADRLDQMFAATTGASCPVSVRRTCVASRREIHNSMSSVAVMKTEISSPFHSGKGYDDKCPPRGLSTTGIDRCPCLHDQILSRMSFWRNL